MLTEVDLVIRNAKIWVTSNLTFEGGIAIKDGKVASLARDANMPYSDSTIDAKGKVVVPGAIDGHVHINEPWERIDREQWLAASDIVHDTRGAVKGGTTTVLDHPVTQPLILNLKALDFKRSLWNTKSYADFGLIGGFTTKEKERTLDFENIRQMWEDGAVGFKTFLCFSSTEWPAMNNDGDLLDFLRFFATINALPLFHAENDFMLTHNRARLEDEGRKDFKAHLEWRPPIAELESVRRTCFYLTQTHSKGSFVHLSLPESVEEIGSAKRLGHSIYAETCPQYLYLTSSDLLEKGPWRKCAPPLRDKDTVLRMWEAVRREQVDLIGSDHAPWTKSQKEAGIDNIWSAPNGMPGVETLYPLMLNAASEGKLPLATVIRLVSENPAKIYGLFPRKGNLMVGADADLVIVDMKAEEKIKNESLEMKCGWTPYEGMVLHAVPIMTLIRGRVVMQDREVIGREGGGTFIPRIGSNYQRLVEAKAQV